MAVFDFNTVHRPDFICISAQYTYVMMMMMTMTMLMMMVIKNKVSADMESVPNPKIVGNKQINKNT